jgi:hypothetical protein
MSSLSAQGQRISPKAAGTAVAVVQKRLQRLIRADRLESLAVKDYGHWYSGDGSTSAAPASKGYQST